MQIPHDLALFAAQSFFLMANLDEELFQSDLRAYQTLQLYGRTTPRDLC